MLCCVIYIALSLIIYFPIPIVTSPKGPLKVFIFAGQSNMKGQSNHYENLPLPLQKEQKLALYFTGEDWVPVARHVTEPTGFGPEVSFSHMMTNVLREPIGIIKLSKTAVSLAEDWSPDKPGSLYFKLLEMIKSAQKSRRIEIVGMLWMQGELDSRHKDMALAYQKNLARFIRSIRRDIRNDNMVFISGRIGQIDTPFCDVVRKAQENLRVDHYAFINTDSFTRFEDRFHLSEHGVLVLGYYFTVKMLDFII